MKHSVKLSLAVMALAAGTAAQAQSAGSLMARVGVMRISPSVTSDDLTPPSFPGTKVDMDSATPLTGGMTYMVSDHFAVDIPVALPSRYNITGAGAIAGVGRLADAKVMPISVLAQYRFGEANAKFRPYVGAGPTYAKFFKERSANTLTALSGGTPANPTTFSIESKLVPTLQLGATMALNDRWFVDAMVARTWLKTHARLSTGQTLGVRLDPTSVALTVGYRY